MALPLTSLQARQERAEEMKLAKKRADNAERNRRFINARQRVIGVDLQALDIQCMEKQLIKDNEKELNALEKLKAQEMNRIMEEAADEERRLKQFLYDELKNDWQAAMSEKARKEAEPEVIRGSQEDSSSFQTFKGEDTLRTERIKLQQDQMRRWTQEQVTEKAFGRYRDNQERMQYAELLKTIDRVREESEQEEAAMSRMAKKIQVMENDKVIQANREKREKEKEDSMQDRVGFIMDLSEDQAVAMDEHGRIINKSAFRGFTEGQRTKLLLENEALRDIKRQAAEAEVQYNQDWAFQQYQANRAMEEAHQEEKYLRNAENERHLKIIAEQQRTERERKANSERNKFGSIGEGFFSDFGKSCR